MVDDLMMFWHTATGHLASYMVCTYVLYISCISGFIYIFHVFIYSFIMYFLDLYIYISCIYIIYIFQVCIIYFTTEGFFKVAVESWLEWDLKPRPLNSVQIIYIYIHIYIYTHIYNIYITHIYNTYNIYNTYIYIAHIFQIHICIALNFFNISFSPP